MAATHHPGEETRRSSFMWGSARIAAVMLMLLVGAGCATREAPELPDAVDPPGPTERDRADAGDDDSEVAAVESTTSTTSSAPPTPATSSHLDAERAALASLPIASDSPATPYERDDYQPSGWPDTDGDCQNDRHEVLAEESLDPVTWDDSGCFVDTGRWVDPYDRQTFTSAAEVTIDHVIPLGHAHRVGADAWDDATKQAFASDLEHAGALIVVGQASNQAKADSSPADWRPPDPASWCRFAVDWIHGKSRWGLALESEAERTALTDMLDTCADPDSLPLRPDQTQPPRSAAVTIAPATSTTTTTIVPEGEETPRIVSCLRRAETVTIANDGAAPLDMTGYRLHDDGTKHTYTFPNGFTLSGGETVTVVSGDDAEAGDGELFWKGQNVWNNDGDIAFLISPDGTTISLPCS